MKVGEMVYYISQGKLHYGMMVHNDNGILCIREKKNVVRKRASQVASEVSDECRRFGLGGIGKGGSGQGVVRCKGKEE